jgi:hypothetical protein
MREKRDDLPFDVQKLPLPSATAEPTYAGWRQWLEDIKEIVEAQHYSTLTGSQRQVLSLGLGDMVEGLAAPPLELVVSYEVFKEKLRAAKVLAWEKERREGPMRAPEGSLKPTPALQAVLEIVEPEVMQWTPSAEDLAWMERAYKPVETTAQAEPVQVPDLPWLPQGPAKIVALLRSAADPLGNVTLSQTAIVAQTGLDRRYVQRLLDRLVDSTLLETVRPGYRYKKADGYKYQPSQYRFSPTPNILQAKAVLLRPAGRPRKSDRLGGRNETA